MNKRLKRKVGNYLTSIIFVIVAVFIVKVEWEAFKFLFTANTLTAFWLGVHTIWLLILTVLVLRKGK